MYPSREEFSELIYYISELKHQYTNKIDEQSTKINEQSMIIEELLWQVRELSDKIRQINQWKVEVDKVISDSREKFNEVTRSCICRYENHIPKNRIINSRQGLIDNHHLNDITKESNNANKNDDDVYETIDFSDSSHHIYTEPFKTESNYGALRKVTVKTNNSKQTTLSTNKKSVNSVSSSKKGIKKSTRVRNLQKFPASQDVSKAQHSEDDSEKDEVDGTKVQLRVKSTSPSNMTSNSRQIASKQINALVSDIEVGFIRSNRENLASFIPQRDASGILINFDYSKLRQQSETHERGSL
ncbi:uncharacterized protein DDB_G0280579-like isoform X2 [Chironomus tepperi]|uniref:uncharacterized protein DDB_G0280579-like isoform X2 n=1 Tax=Chironomus tepperi TaxID=113505 RepID=UPI00391F10F0